MKSHVQSWRVPMQNLPLIDVGGLRDGSPSDVQSIADQLGYAAREIGFFRIRNHGIPADLINGTYESAAEFFAQPESKKLDYYIGLSRNHRGYVPFTEKGDYADEVNRNYEAFDLGLDLPEDDPEFLAGNILLGPNVWPDVPGFKKQISRYYDEVAKLGRLICGALELHLGLPRAAITQHMTKPISQLRLLHYVRRDDGVESKSVNMGAHTDYECLTLLNTRNAGLQVMAQDDRWIDVPADPSVYIVNIGDMLEAWTNGLFRSTPHRVLNLSKERYSIPYFVAANHDTKIMPFHQLLQKNEPPKYKPFKAGAHLEHMLRRDFPYLRDRYAKMMGASAEPSADKVQNPFENRIARRNML